ncbi:MAG: ferrous iron transporter B [Endomicrobia bacterium]|nr:ferrous iron transporter B [Endomicrobiia bacterium]MDW8055368.1 ferrous iron transporter B [Elusimicrobiota bacterium]
MKKILLVGCPNVGKSVIFSRLTGIDVISSNYPGTTVEITKGYLKVGQETYEVIDLPGSYSLDPTCKAEEVTVNLLQQYLESKESTIVVNILDATNLERNLNLTLQLIQRKIPLILVLNFWDEVKHKGITIDYEKLEELLGIPVIPTCARSGEGIKELTQRINQAKISNYNFVPEQKWYKIGSIVEQVQKVTHRHHTFLERLSEISIRPSTGLPLALVVLFLTFFITRILAESLITYVCDPLFHNLYLPVIKKFIIKTVHLKLLQDIFLGITPEPMESFGILTTGLYIPFVVVLPYVIAFYFILGILEDTGYLPRLATLLDRFLHKLGIHGYSSIPILLGFGCKVPGILATRILETTREKIIAIVLILMLTPCIPQSAMIVSLISPFGIRYVFLVFLIIFLNGIFFSYILNKIFPKIEISELFLEIPPYRLIHLPTLTKKLYVRIKQFIFDAVPLIIIGIIIINIFELTGVNTRITNIIGKYFVSILGLPEEISSIVILGFLRKDVSIALLSPYKLDIKQLIVATIFMTLYLPCVSTFFTILKEQGIKNTIVIVVLTFISGTVLAYVIKTLIFNFF